MYNTINGGIDMYKIIASDLDETLLDDHHQICEANKKAIHEASKRGVKFVPCTGRGYMAIQAILKDLDLDDKENEYSISFNGCALTENKNNRLIFFNGLDFDKAAELFEFGKTKDVCIHVYTSTEVYVYNLNEDERQRFYNQKNTFIEIEGESIEFLRDEPIAKVLYQNVDVPYLKSFEEEMRSLTDDAVSVSYSSNRYMELNRLGVNKGDTLRQLAKLLGCDIEQTIGVGDNYNDMPMLLAAGLSVAAGNSVPDVKEACDYVCENDNNQGVLAELIEKFILNEK